MKDWKQFNENNDTPIPIVELFNKHMKGFRYNGEKTVIKGLVISGGYNIKSIKTYYGIGKKSFSGLWFSLEELTIEDITHSCQNYINEYNNNNNFGGYRDEYKSIVDFLLRMIENPEFVEEYNTIKDSIELGLL